MLRPYFSSVSQIILRYARILLSAIAGLSLVTITALLTLDGVTRAFFDAPLHGTREISSVLLATTLLCIQPMIAAFGPYIRMDIVYNLMPAGLQRHIDNFGSLLMAIFYMIIAASSIPWAAASLQIREFTAGIVAVPVYPAKVLFAATMSYLVLYYVAVTMRRLFSRPAPDV